MSSITVSPPRGASGIADMLVALGNAKITVVHAEPDADDSGRYRLTVERLAGVVPALSGIGCRVHGFTISPRDDN